MQKVTPTVLMMLVAISVTSCKEEPVGGGTGQQVLPVELTFRDQAEDVKSGESSSILVHQETIDDAHLVHLEGLKGLESLNLPNCSVTDQGLAMLVELPNLIQLRLNSPQVTDAGLKEIAKIKSLRFLHLINAPITDDGLAHLHEMTWLESFYLDGSKTTEEGLERLNAALPELHIHKDQLHLPSDSSDHEHH